MADFDATIDQPPSTETAKSPPTDATAPKGWRRIPRPLRILLYIVGTVFALWLILFITKGRFLKKPFESIASKTMDRKVTIGGDFQLYFDVINIKFLAEKFDVANPAWAGITPLFHADLINTRISTVRLIFGHQRINWLELRNGAADLRWSPDGKTNTWTFTKPDPKVPPTPFHLPDIRQGIITGTEVHYNDPRMMLDTRIQVDTIKARDTRFANDIRFAGKGVMRHQPFTLSGRQLSPNDLIAGGKNQLTVHIESGDGKGDIWGTLPAATEIDGADLHLQVTGANLARLFDFIGVAIPDTRRYRIRSALTYQNKQWRFARLHGVFGDSDISGNLVVGFPNERLHMGATLATDSLDMIDAGPFVGYSPEALDAKGAAATVQTVNGHPRLLPDAPLRVDAISRFDADVKWTVRTVKGKNIPISNIALTLGLDRSLLQLSPLTFDMAGGFLSSDIIIDARKRPVHTDYDIRLSPTPMGKLLGRWGVEESGTTGTMKARIKLAGEGDTVHDSLSSANGRIAVILPKGSMWARNIQLSEIDVGVFIQKMFQNKLKEPVQINCGLIAFTVRNGVAAADPILIDTTKNVIVARGGFSFKTEAMDLAFRADGKKFSLFSGQSPIGIGGYFAAPGISVISPELVGRAGAAIGLGIFASPLASVLAFVDIGDAQSAACGPVLAGATASQQKTSTGKPRNDVGKGTSAKSESGKQSAGDKAEQRHKFLGIF